MGSKNFQKYIGVKQFRSKEGLTYPQSLIQAQADTNASKYSITTSGELDTLRYGDILRARKAGGYKRLWLGL